MEKIDWNPSFSVGVKLLDEQHKQIIGMINRLISDREATVRSETISDLLDGLTKYAKDHFRTEERLLEKYGYPDLARQKEEHKAYRIKIVAFCQSCNQSRRFRARGASQVHPRLVGEPHPGNRHEVSLLPHGAWRQVGRVNSGISGGTNVLSLRAN